MKLSLYTPLYALTLLLSAALLFSVQPMFSKMILPLLGGTSNVWNTAMLFFQVVLLAGYAYAHGTTRFLNIKAQAMIHFIVLLVFIVVLPFGIPEGWVPPVNDDPTVWQLSLMTITVGGPFFVLAASAPMLQRWFSHTDHPDAQDPYFLYGASNLGSMSSLLLYPIAIEPLLTLSEQADIWMYGYFLLILMFALAALFVWPYATSKSSASKTTSLEPVQWRTRLEWIALAFIPSSLMLGVTTFITTDIASAPLIWIIPLTLYVGTFILVFARKIYLNTTHLAYIQGGTLALVAITMVSGDGMHSLYYMGLHLALFFFTAWMCHAILASKRPEPGHLTEFYLLMSLGGALGGFFNAIIAPQIFTSSLEYPLILAVACFYRFIASSKAEGTSEKNPLKTLNLFGIVAVFICIALSLTLFSVHPAIPLLCGFVTMIAMVFMIDQRYSFAISAALILIVNPSVAQFNMQSHRLHSERNFFGIVGVYNNPESEIRTLLHGQTNHGTQSQNPKYEHLGISYYSEFSPLSDAFSILDEKDDEQTIAILGLGAGATACFTKEKRHFDFFEIDPAVVRIAEDPQYFTYLSGCGSPYEITLGDARITLRDKPDKRYDLILLDVFSSDNIPTHLLTEEAIQMYLSKLKEDGLLVFHISNLYLNLEPVLSDTAQKIGISGYARFGPEGILEESQIEYSPSHYFVMTHSEEVLEKLQERNEFWSPGILEEHISSWSDSFSNIVSVFGNDSIIKRTIVMLKKMQADQAAAEEASQADVSE